MAVSGVQLVCGEIQIILIKHSHIKVVFKLASGIGYNKQKSLQYICIVKTDYNLYINVATSYLPVLEMYI